VPVKLNFSVTPVNAADTAAVYAFAQEHSLPLQAATYMFPPVRACENGPCAAERMTPEQSAAAQIACDRLRFAPDTLRERWEKQLAGAAVPDPDRECQELPNERIRCRAGSSTFWVTWDGQMRPCGMMTAPTADIGALGFDSAWQAIRAAREQIFLPPACSTCADKNVCDQCAAICFAETGAFIGVPEYMCARTRALQAAIREELGKI
ncbi:MAG: hypothetical protein ACI4PV_01075, partial [Butyricicoccus sp.]